MQGQFNNETTEFLCSTSAARNKDAGAQVKNTTYQCIIACLVKIQNLYGKGKRTETGKGLCCLNNIRDKEKEEIIEHFDKQEWGKLKYYLGSPLPEVNDETYFQYPITCSSYELGWKEMRNLIVWQLWIEKLWDMYSPFNEEIQKVLKDQSKYRIRDALFGADEECVKNITIEELEIFKHLDNENKNYKAEIKDSYLKDFQTTKNRVNWFMCKMMETTARKKEDLMTDVEITSKQTKLSPPKSLRHMMQFMSYISMTEKELSNSLSILDKLKDADEDWFLSTIGKTII